MCADLMVITLDKSEFESQDLGKLPERFNRNLKAFHRNAGILTQWFSNRSVRTATKRSPGHGRRQDQKRHIAMSYDPSPRRFCQSIFRYAAQNEDIFGIRVLNLAAVEPDADPRREAIRTADFGLHGQTLRTTKLPLSAMYRLPPVSTARRVLLLTSGGSP
jgi:hypothetical protein